MKRRDYKQRPKKPKEQRRNAPQGIRISDTPGMLGRTLLIALATLIESGMKPHEARRKVALDWGPVIEPMYSRAYAEEQVGKMWTKWKGLLLAKTLDLDYGRTGGTDADFENILDNILHEIAAQNSAQAIDS